MPTVVVGLNHKTAPVSLLERLAITDERLAKALHQLSGYEHVTESVLLSTCNRVEVYADVTKFHGGAQDLRNFLAEFCHIAPEEFVDHLYTYHDEAAVRHLFRVAAGIDSLVVGESEILGQVRRALQVATEEGACGRVLGAAFRGALRVGKRSRSETAIGRNPASVSSAAVELARRALPGETLAGRRVAIVGAGKMGRLAAQALAAAGASDVTIVNRSGERALSLAEAFDARARPLEELTDVLAGADILISSTTAPGVIITRDAVERSRQRRTDPLLIVDIAVPRDVETDVARIPGVVLRDIDDLQAVVESSLGSRRGEVAKVERIISSELERFERRERASEVAPAIAELLERAEVMRAAEVERVGMRLQGLSEADRAAVEQLSRRLVAKLLHAPVEKAKALGDSKQGGHYLAALRELFDLDEQ
jgi:glutamyl-tRNA reductase